MSAQRSAKPLARLWWWLLPAAGFFAYRDMTTRWERIRWAVPYGLWQIVGWLPGSDPYKPMPRIVCDCDLCQPPAPSSSSLGALSAAPGSTAGEAGRALANTASAPDGEACS